MSFDFSPTNSPYKMTSCWEFGKISYMINSCNHVKNLICISIQKLINTTLASKQKLQIIKVFLLQNVIYIYIRHIEKKTKKKNQKNVSKKLNN